MTKVLIFESDAAFAQSLVEGLAARRCIVEVVDDGEAGILRAELDPPQLILLSIELPRMNGFSVCNKLKRHKTLANVPLVLMSSEASDETFEQHKRLRTRAEEYVHKPIAVADLMATVEPLIQWPEVVAPHEADIEAEAEDAFEHLLAPASVRPASMSMAEAGGRSRSVPPPSQPPPMPSVPASFRGSQAPPPSGTQSSLPPPSAPPPSGPVSSVLPPSSSARSSLSPMSARLSDIPIEVPADETFLEDIEIVPDESAEAPEVGSADSGFAARLGDLEQTLSEKEGRVRELELELAATIARVADFEATRQSLQEVLATQRETHQQQLDKKEAELRLAHQEVDELKAKVSQKEGGGTAREFLDLREQLNRKDKEILEVRDSLTSRERELIKTRDSNIALEREKEDLADSIRGLSGEKSALEKERDALVADKAQANKRADDFKAKSERLGEELAARHVELDELKAVRASDEERHQAELARLHGEHRAGLEATLHQASIDQEHAVAQAIRASEERLAIEREEALRNADAEARQAQSEALQSREAELLREHEGKMASLHRANEEGLRKLKAEHQQAMDEAFAEAERRLHVREDELLQERTALLVEQKAQSDAQFQELLHQKAQAEGERDARISGLLSDLEVRAEELEGLRRALAERDGRASQLEAEIASVRVELREITERLNDESSRLVVARQKWSEDANALDQARQSLEHALSMIQSTTSRPIP